MTPLRRGFPWVIVALLAGMQLAGTGVALAQSAPQGKSPHYFAGREAQRYADRARDVGEQQRGPFVEQRRLLGLKTTTEQQKAAATAQVTALTPVVQQLEAAQAQLTPAGPLATALASTASAPESYKTAAASTSQLLAELTKIAGERKALVAAATQAQAQATAQIAALEPQIKAAGDARAAAEKLVVEASNAAKAAIDRITVLDTKGDQPDPAQARQVAKIAHNRGLLTCRFDGNGEWLWTGGEDNTIHRFDWISGAKESFAGHKSWVGSLAFAGVASGFVSGGYEGQLLFWDAATGKGAPVRTVDAHKGFLRSISISPDGKVLVTGGNDMLVKAWNIADGTLLATLEGHQSHVYSVAFSRDGTRLVSGDLKGVVKDWDTTTWKHVRDLDAAVMTKYDPSFKADVGGVRCIDFSPDGKFLALGGIGDVSNAFAGVGKPIVVLFDWESGKQLRVMESADAFQGSVFGVRFSPTGDFIVGAGGGNGGALWFWKPQDVKSFHMVKIDQVARDLAMHPDGLRLAVPCFDMSLRIFDLTPAP